MQRKSIVKLSVFFFVFVLFVTQIILSTDTMGQVSSEFEIAATNLTEWIPKIAYNSVDDEFLVVWTEQGVREPEGPSLYGIVAQRFSSLGEKITSSINPAGDPVSKIVLLPTPEHNEFTNEYLIAYTMSGIGFDQFCTIINNTGTIMEEPFPISEKLRSQMHSSVAFNTQEREFFVVYNSSESGSPDIKGVILDEDGTPVSGELMINDTEGDQYNPYIVYNPTDNTYLINWEDFRNVPTWQENSDIYGALLDSNGNVIVNDIPMLDDFGTEDEGDQRHNNIVYNPDKNEFLVSWSDNGRPSLQNGGAVGRIVYADGTLANSEIIISDEAGFQMFPHLVYIEEKQMYFALWEDGRNNTNPNTIYWRDATNWDLYAGWIDSSGNRVGYDISICTKAGIQRYAKVSYSPVADKFLIAWQDVVEETGWGVGGEQHVTEEGGNIMGAIYAPSSATTIPTLSEWGMIIFMTLILGISVVMLYRRRKI